MSTRHSSIERTVVAHSECVKFCRLLRGTAKPHQALAVRPARMTSLRLTYVDTGVQRDEGETMTTLENRPNTALLVVDVQNGVVEGTPERDAVVANVGSLVEKA